MSAAVLEMPLAAGRPAIDGAVYLPVNLLASSPTNPRKRFDPKTLDELAESIRKHSVLQPILVRPRAGAVAGDALYEIVAGERRWRASKLAEVEAIPAIVREMSDFEVLELQIIENLQRDDLHPLEEAEGYGALMRKPDGVHGYANAEELAARIGKSRSYVFGRLKLCALCEPARKAFLDGTFNASVALLIARMPESVQAKATADIVKGWGGEPMSYRAARDHLEQHFMLRLGSAPFKINDANLVVDAGACHTCSKRTGANPDLFDDVKGADVCTDSVCFNGKKEAHQAQLLATAKAEGREVITGAAAKKVKPHHYSHSLVGYLRVDEPDYRVNGSKPLSKLLGKDSPPVALLEDPHSHELIRVVREAEAIEVLKEKGHVKTSRLPSSSDSQRKAEAKAKAENLWRAALAERAVAAAVDPTFDDLDIHSWLLPELAIAMWNRLDHETSKRALKLLGWEPFSRNGYEESEVKRSTEHFRKLATRELDQALVAMAVAGQMHVGSYGVDSKPERLLEIAGRLGIDGAAVRAELAAAAKVKQAKKKPPAKKAKAATRAAAPKQGKRKAAKASKAAVRYRNPDTGETWSGRGLRPAWLNAALAGGRSLADFDTKAATSPGDVPTFKADTPATTLTYVATAPAVQLSSVAAWPFPKGAA